MTDTKHETKQNASHTPGEWLQNLSYGDHEYATIEVAGKAIAVVLTEDDTEATQEEIANARLLKAAPKLLQSLQEVVRICEAIRYTAGLGRNQLERIERAKAAIAEAKGLAA